MNDYSEKTANMPSKVSRLSHELATKQWISASGIAIELMCDLAYVIAFCKSKK